MNVASVLLWGFAGTVILTMVLALSQGLGLTRMSIPFILGTILTPHRDRALLLGSVFHLVNGWIFALIYAAAFESWGLATWWAGAGIGLVHALFVLAVGMPVVPAIHPRMVSDYFGPAVNRQLQPPGFMALQYGRRTPVATILAHLIYGGVIGAFYRLSG